MLRNQPQKYKEMVKKDMEASKADIPAGYVMPTAEDAFKTVKAEDFNMDWDDSDEEPDFGDDSDEFDEDMEVDDEDSGSEGEEQDDDEDED